MSILFQDNSHYQQYIDFAYLKTKGQNKMILKAASGSLFKDDKFEEHYVGGVANGFSIAPFFWVDPIYDAAQQAQFFLDAIKGKDIAFIELDWEHWWADWDKWQQWNNKQISQSQVPRVSADKIFTHFKTVYEYVEKNSPYNIVVYTANWFLQAYCPQGFEYLKDKYTHWSDYTLVQNIPSGEKTWEYLETIAPVGKRIPTLPLNYPLDKVVFFQFSGDRFTAKGVYSDVAKTRLSDLDLNIEVNPVITWDKLKEGAKMILYYPLPEGIRVSQKFGENPNWYPASQGHNGIDWACPVGTKLYAAQDGEVIRADMLQGQTGYGRHVRIQTKDGILIYGHLSKLECAVGDIVKAKQEIGLSGGATNDPGSGFSTGAHLHFEIRPTSGGSNTPGGYLGAIDPTPYLVGWQSIPTPVVLFHGKCLVSRLNIRAGAGIHYADIGDLVLNQIVSVYKVDEATGWWKIDGTLDKWVSSYFTYMQKIPLPTPPPVVVPSEKLWENMNVDEKIERLKLEHPDIK